MRAAPSRSSFGLPWRRASIVGGGMVAAWRRPEATHAPVGAVPTALFLLCFFSDSDGGYAAEVIDLFWDEGGYAAEACGLFTFM
jgi:hypothetical protein